MAFLRLLRGYLHKTGSIATPVAWLCFCQLAMAASPEQIKAAYIYNFTQYVSWPKEAFANATAPFNLCIDAAPDFIEIMRLTVQDEQVNHHDIKIHKQHDNCHLLYIAQGSANQTTAYYHAPPEHTLIVSDIPECALRGAMIELRQEKTKLRIYINRKQTDKAGLSIRANLLSLAVIVDNLEAEQ